MRANNILFDWLTTIVLTLVLCTACFGKIIYVDDSATGSNNGSSWENAYVYLQEALADAQSAVKPVEIRVAQGIYKPDQGHKPKLGDRGASFQLINEVALMGGYAGTGSPDPNARDVDLYQTILNGDLNGDDTFIEDPCDLYDEPTRSDNSVHVVESSNVNETSILDGFIITGGYYKGWTIDTIYGGGGMINSLGSPTLNNCTFIENYTSGCGGGLLNLYDCNPILTDCKFVRNYCGSGGGVYNTSSSPILKNCTFTSNYAEHSGAGMGNGTSWIYLQTSNPRLIDCIFGNNYACYYGGGLLSSDGDAALTNCIFTNNSASQGGGMYNHSGSSILNGCRFIENNAQEKGGGLANGDEANSKFMDCIFISNASNGCGGGLAGCNSIYNCIMSSNLAVKDGGAIYGWGEVINCTIIGNKANRNGGGIYTQDITTLIDSILWSNNALIGDEIYLGSIVTPLGRRGTVIITPSTLTASYSNIQGGEEKVLIDTDCTLVWETGNIDEDPLFANPGYWASATDLNLIVEPNDPNAIWVDGDYHLISQDGRWDPVSESWIIDDLTSPCIDAGDPASPFGDEPEPNGGRINMGAYGGTIEASKSSVD